MTLVGAFPIGELDLTLMVISFDSPGASQKKLSLVVNMPPSRSMIVIGEGFFPLFVTVRLQRLSLTFVRGETAKMVLLLATVGFSQGPWSMVGHSGADSTYFL